MKVRVPENLFEYVNLTNKELKNMLSGVNTNPTKAQIESGNYKKGHVKIHGFDITIENPIDSYRRGVDEDGESWEIKMSSHYGYFKTTEGRDGDHVDVFIGTKLKSDKIFVVDQFVNGKFDEHKVMMCFNSITDARDAYKANYTSGWDGLKYINEVDCETFKKWLYSGTKKMKPFNDYKINK